MQNNKLTSTVIDKHGSEWSVTASVVYESLIENAPIFSRFTSDKYPDVVSNIAGQLQFIEFTELLLNNFDFEPEGEEELPEFVGGGTAWIHNEVEHSLYKQGMIGAASIAEAVCFILVKSSGIELPERFSFKKLTEVAEQNNVIDTFDAGLLHQLRELRNSLHLYIDSYDVAFYHAEQYNTAKSCLYWILIKLLGIDEKVMSIHFPYLPKQDKGELYFEV